MTDKPAPHSTEAHTGAEDRRGVQPALLLTGIFGAAIGMGAILLGARAANRRGNDPAPPNP